MREQLRSCIIFIFSGFVILKGFDVKLLCSLLSCLLLCSRKSTEDANIEVPDQFLVLLQIPTRTNYDVLLSGLSMMSRLARNRLQLSAEGFGDSTIDWDQIEM